MLVDVNDNWRGGLEAMAEHVATGASRRFGSVAAASTGVPIPLFNQAFVFRAPDPDDLSAAVSWMFDRAVPFWVTVPAPLVHEVERLADRVGLVLSEGSMPGMALAPLQDLAAVPAAAADIVPVIDGEQLEHVAVVTAEAFGAPLAPARALAPVSVLEDDRMKWFVGYVDGEPVACAQLLRTGSVAGLYAVAVREAHRRRGIGEAISWQVLHAGWEAGCEVGVLQASPMGQPVYQRMGFREAGRYHQFVPESGGA